MECMLKINNVCKGEKYHGEPCSRLRPLMCDEKKRFELAMELKRQLIHAEMYDRKELGIGA